MIKAYSISDIIVSNSKHDTFYIGTFEHTEDPEIVWPHRHNFYSIVWFTHGSGINVIDFEEYQILPNRLFLTLPQQVHNWSYSSDTKGYIFVFEKHFIPHFPQELLNYSFFDLNPNHSKILSALFHHLIEEATHRDELSLNIIASGLGFLTLQLLRVPSQSKHCGKIKPKTLLEFSKLVAETSNGSFGVRDYAKQLRISVNELNRLCYEAYGASPKTVILDKKITEAKRLLYFTDLSIKEIAFQLGFEDSSYFSRIFKQKTALTPSEFKLKCT